MKRNFFFFFFFFSFFFTNSIAANCTSHSDCYSCASSSSWLGNCRWCEIDKKCYEEGEISNPCSVFQVIDDPFYCNCSSGCNVQEGYNSSYCNWYTEMDLVVGNDTSLWKGGDFLPYPYAAAAICACEGTGNALWNSKIVDCIRKEVLLGHQKLAPEIKKGLRNVSLYGTCEDSFAYLDNLIEVHSYAYSTCCCVGAPAAYDFWVGVLCMGELPSCTLIEDGILEVGRCGCGW